MKDGAATYRGNMGKRTQKSNKPFFDDAVRTICATTKDQYQSANVVETLTETSEAGNIWDITSWCAAEVEHKVHRYHCSELISAEPTR